MALVATAALGIAGGTHAEATNKDARSAAYKSAEAQYKTDKAACDSMTGNAKDVCIEEAKGNEKVAKAEADASYKDTPRAHESARMAKAEAVYKVAKEKCDDLSGNAKDVCVKEAKANYAKAKADAKSQRVATDTRNTSVARTSEARRDATDTRRDADYNVAIEKCDAMSGAAKDTCVRNAKTRYGKS